jgi:hypothetical protein
MLFINLSFSDLKLLKSIFILLNIYYDLILYRSENYSVIIDHITKGKNYDFFIPLSIEKKDKYDLIEERSISFTVFLLFFDSAFVIHEA